jgi:hypothetical protein
MKDKLTVSTAQFEHRNGDILAECRNLGDDFASAVITPEKLSMSGGYRYIKARRPDLYRDIIGRPHQSDQKVVWLD